MIDIQKEFDTQLDAWLKTEKHLYNCIGYSEGCACCLDEQSGLYGGEGRKFVKGFIDTALQAKQKRLISEIERLYFPTEIIEDGESQEYVFAQKYNQAIRDVLNLINPPSN